MMGILLALCGYAMEKPSVMPSIEGESDVCAGGGFFSYRIANPPTDASFQWYVDGKLQLHEEDSLFQFISSYDENTTSVLDCRVIYQYHEHLPLGCDLLVKDTLLLTHYVRNMACCTDPNGKPVSKRKIWQEDFDGSEVPSTDYQRVIPYLTDGESSDTLFDHTYNRAAGGAMLEIYREEPSDTVLYSQVIKGLCSQYHHTFTAQCYVRTASEVVTSLKLSLRMIDLASGDTVVGGHLSNPFVSHLDWVSLSGQVDLTADSLKLEILTTSDYLKKTGSAYFLLDDVEIWMCVPHDPFLEVYRENEMTAGGLSSRDVAGWDEDGDTTLRFQSDGVNGKLWTVSKIGSVVQYTLTPDEPSSWKTMKDASVVEDLIHREGHLYFRQVMGPAALLNQETLPVDELCSPFSLSNVAEYVQYVPQPEEPLSRPLVSDIVLCEGAPRSYLRLPNTVTSPYYYIWYKDSPDAEGKQGYPVAPSQVRKGERVSVYDYYVSVKNTKTGEESERSHFQVFVFTKPKGIPSETLSVGDSEITLQGAMHDDPIEGCGLLTEIFEDEQATMLSDDQRLSGGNHYIRQRLMVFDSVTSCVGNIRNVSVDMESAHPHLRLSVTDDGVSFHVEMSSDVRYILSLYADASMQNLLRRDTLVWQGGSGETNHFVKLSDGAYYYSLDEMVDEDLRYRTVGSFAKGDLSGAEPLVKERGYALWVADGALHVEVSDEGWLRVTDLMGRGDAAWMERGGTRAFRLSGGVYVVEWNGIASKVVVP